MVFVHDIDRAALGAIFKAIAIGNNDIDPESLVLRSDFNCYSYFNEGHFNKGKDAFQRNGISESDWNRLFLDFYFDLGTNDNDRITSLLICMDEQPSGQHFDLDPRNSKSLLRDPLSKMTNFETLTLGQCSESFLPFILQSRLPHLKELVLVSLSIPESMDIFSQAKEQLPNLESLVLKSIESKVIRKNHLFPGVTSKHSSLRRVVLNDCRFDEDQLETLLFDVLPHFPMVMDLDLWNNNIKSLKPIAGRLRTVADNNFMSKTTLRMLRVEYNPIWESTFDIENPHQNLEETKAVCKVLCAFPNVNFVSSSLSTIHYDPFICNNPAISYELLLNRAGRGLVQGWVDGCPVPQSLWPIILERLNKPDGKIYEYLNSPHASSGLFYFLRNGPIFSGE